MLSFPHKLSEFIPFLPVDNTLETWISQRLKSESISDLKRKFEDSELTQLDNQVLPKDSTKLLSFLSASLDVYSWLISRNAINVELFLPENSSLFDHVDSFFRIFYTELDHMDTSMIQDNVTNSSSVTVLKFDVLIRVYKLFTILIERKHPFPYLDRVRFFDFSSNEISCPISCFFALYLCPFCNPL